MPTVTFRPKDLGGADVAATITISLVTESYARGFFTTASGAVFRPSETIDIDPAAPGSGEVTLAATADIRPASVYQMQARGQRPAYFRVPAGDAYASDLIAAYRDAGG